MDIKFFETEDELAKLTGLNHQELWNNNFDLDDWDWGFCSDKKYVVEHVDEFGGKFCEIKSNVKPSYIQQLLDWMSNYCCGLKYTEFNGKHYYMLYHS